MLSYGRREVAPIYHALMRFAAATIRAMMGALPCFYYAMITQCLQPRMIASLEILAVERI